ncbi:MAG: sarcosine oxidase subunit alpha family protein [Geminicoccaceae bacterium]|nr:sarcosine oxidase subunit alpha family protein [Geminicoccaceae bacterium]
MNQPYRLAGGGAIDRTRPLQFTFDDRVYDAFAGDTLASALLAHGVHLMGRSFKYHRPRGPIAAGAEEPNALVQIEHGGGRTDPNTRATAVEVFQGLYAHSQNRWPSLKSDVGVINDFVSPLIPAAFYYKTFMWPRSFWDKLYEPAIRRAAGLGEAPHQPDPDRYQHRHAHCDVLVVGAGPAGLAAALAAGRAGRRVLLIDENPTLGGTLAHTSTEALADWRDRLTEELVGLPDVTILTRTTVTGYYDHNYLLALERVSDHLPPASSVRQRLWRIRAGRVVLATGAIERPLVFVGNDRPGVMLASAARTYLERFAVLVGRRPLFFTNNDSAYAVASAMKAAGAEVVAVVDVRSDPKGPLVQAARDAGIIVRTNAVVVGTEGRHRIHQAALGTLDDQGVLTGHLGTPVGCDVLLMSGGWNPNVSLHSQGRGKLRYDDGLAAFVPDGGQQQSASAGACNGVMNTARAVAEGAAAGGGAVDAPAFEEPEEESLRPVQVVPSDRSGARAKAFVDFQNDVTAKDLGIAVREGMISIEHVKRFTTTGMATDQGKTSSVNAIAIVAEQLGTPIPAVGTTTYRPPYVPLTFGAAAGHSRGRLFDVVRRTPMHGWAAEHGAVFEDVGNWKRAWYFPRSGEDMHAAVQRECKAVREGCGLMDASTLGKIDVRGKDARAFLNRVYTNAWSKLEPGRCRYGLMLRDDGFVFDDGVTACLADDHFHMTTTTGGAPRVLAWLEDLSQTEWPDLEVYFTSVTEQWATMALSGPDARDLLQPLVEEDISAAALPHLAWMEATIAGVAGRIFRISFTGERAFEINVPAGYGRHVWQALVDAGEAHGLCLYGTETMHVLRAEKGYIIVGQETDGTVTPYDLGMDWIVSTKKGDFAGKRGLLRPDLQAEGRKQLVGLATLDPDVVLDEGAQITAEAEPRIPARMLGHVTSSYMSPNCGRSIALALLAGGRERIGSHLFVPQLDGPAVEVEVVAPVFFDPKGERLNG